MSCPIEKVFLPWLSPQQPLNAIARIVNSLMPRVPAIPLGGNPVVP